MDRIIVIEGQNLEHLIYNLQRAHENGELRSLRVCIEDDSAKLKINQQWWSPPMGKLDPECFAAQQKQAQIAEMIGETQEPEICQSCGKHYNGITCLQYEELV